MLDICMAMGLSALELAQTVHSMWIDEAISLLIALVRVYEIQLPA